MAISDLEPVVQRYEAEFESIISQMSIKSLFSIDSLNYKINCLFRETEEALNLEHSDTKLCYKSDWSSLANDFVSFENPNQGNTECVFYINGYKCSIDYIDCIKLRELEVRRDHPFIVFRVDLATWTQEEACIYIRRVLGLINDIYPKWAEAQRKTEEERKRIYEILQPYSEREKELLRMAEERVDADLRAGITDLVSQYVEVRRKEWAAVPGYFDEPFNEGKCAKEIIRSASNPIYSQRIYKMLEADENADFDQLLEDLIFGIELREGEMKFKESYIESFWKAVKSQKGVLKRNRTRQAKMDEASRPFIEPNEEMKEIVAGGYEYKRVDPYNSKHYHQHTFTSPNGNKISICCGEEDAEYVANYALTVVPLLFKVVDSVKFKPKYYSGDPVKTRKDIDFTVKYRKESRGIVFDCPTEVEKSSRGWFDRGVRLTLDKGSSEEDIAAFKKLLDDLRDVSLEQIVWWII